MLPFPRPPFALAAVSLLFIATLVVASDAGDAPPAFATVGASAGFSAGARDASAGASASAVAELPQGDRAAAAPAEESSGASKNETRRPPAGPTPPPEERPGAAPVLSPEYQRVRGVAGAPVAFDLLVQNVGDAPQHVHLSASAPAWWRVSLSPDNVTLAPGESAAIEGRIDTRPGLGGEAILRIVAQGRGGNDAAFVDACIASAHVTAPSCVRTPSRNGTHNGTRPGENTTFPPPKEPSCARANDTTACPNGTRPRDPPPCGYHNDTSACPPPCGYRNDTSACPQPCGYRNDTSACPQPCGYRNETRACPPPHNGTDPLDPAPEGSLPTSQPAPAAPPGPQPVAVDAWAAGTSRPPDEDPYTAVDVEV